MRTVILVVATTVVIAAMSSTPAQAQNNRSFVSGHGSDSNSCALTAPCRSFSQALGATSAGGEIVVLDSAGYGRLTIDRSITITNPGGVEAGITTTAGQSAITFNPSSPFVVTLRGLTLEGGGVGADGIQFEPTVQGTLNIIDCVVKDFTGAGIRIQPSISGTGVQASYVLVINSFALNNTGAGIDISIGPQGTSTALGYDIDYTTVVSNGTNGTNGGIVVTSGNGNLSGSILAANVHQNSIGINLVGSTTSVAYIRNSSVTSNKIFDIYNNSSGSNLDLLDSSQVGSLFNPNLVNSDGTNDVVSLSGNALTPFSRQ